MPVIDPFSPDTVFPNQIDSFPSLVDAGYSDGAIPSSWSTVWASHFNKVANIVKKMQVGLTKMTESARNDSTFKGITGLYTFELSGIGVFDQHANNNSYGLYGLFVKSHMLPFEIVLTSNPDNVYMDGNYSRTVSLTPQSVLDTMFAAENIYGLKLMASCSLTKFDSEVLGTSDWRSRLLINSWVTLSSDTIIVRGTIVNTDLPTISDTYSTYQDGFLVTNDNVALACTIFGVKV